MKLLSSVLPRGGRLLTAGGWFTLALCGVLLGQEVFGRFYAVSDFHDALAGFGLLIAVLAIAARHRRQRSGGGCPSGPWARRGARGPAPPPPRPRRPPPATPPHRPRAPPARPEPPPPPR